MFFQNYTKVNINKSTDCNLGHTLLELVNVQCTFIINKLLMDSSWMYIRHKGLKGVSLIPIALFSLVQLLVGVN